MHNKRILETRAMAKSLAEQRADALKEMQSILDTAKTENRAMKEDETKRLEELKKELEAYSDIPLFPFSALNGEGTEEIREYIQQCVLEFEPEDDI